MTCLTAPPPSRQAFAPALAVQLTANVAESAQLGAGSPSDTLKVSVTVPGAVQVNRGLGDDASVSTPLDAVHWYASGDGPLSASCAWALRPIEPPTRTSAGLAPVPSTVGQTFRVPLIETLPVRGASWQTR